MRDDVERGSAPVRDRRQLLLATAGFMFVAVAGCDDDEATPTADATVPDANGGLNSNDGSSRLDAASSDSGMLDSASPAPVDASATDSDAAGSAPDADVTPLNSLLRFEYGVRAALSVAIERETVLPTAPPGDDADAGQSVDYRRRDCATLFMDLRQQHQLHVDALASTIRTLGGEPVSESAYASAYVVPVELSSNVTLQNLIKLVARAERDAMIAFNRAVSSLEAASSRYLVVNIESGQAQALQTLRWLLKHAGGFISDPTRSAAFLPRPFALTQPGQNNGLAPTT